MKLDFDNFPAMKNLAADVRQKAVEFAESLGARGPRPTTVLGTAVTLAREWKSGRLPTRPISAPFLVQPRAGRWIIKRSTDEKASHTFMRMDDAVRRAQQLAREAGAACFVFGPGGTLIERFEARVIAEMKLPKEPVVEASEVQDAVEEKSEAVCAPLEVAPAVEASPVADAVAQIDVANAIQVEEIQIVQAIGTPIEVVETHAAPTIEVFETLEKNVEAPIEAVETQAAEVTEASGPIRVKKAHGKWAVLIDEVVEVLPTRAKAIKRAFELGHKLGRQVLS